MPAVEELSQRCTGKANSLVQAGRAAGSGYAPGFLSVGSTRGAASLPRPDVLLASRHVAQSLRTCMVYATPPVERSIPVCDCHCCSAGHSVSAAPEDASSRTRTQLFANLPAFRQCRRRPDGNSCRCCNQPRTVEGNGFRSKGDRQQFQSLARDAATDSGPGGESWDQRHFRSHLRKAGWAGRSLLSPAVPKGSLQWA